MEDCLMHVLQVTPRYPPHMGGVETVVQRVSELLVAKGVDVTVYSVDLERRLPRRQKVNGVLVKRFAPLFGDPLYFPEPRFIGGLRQEKAEIVHVHNAHTLPPFLAALSKRRDQRFLLQPYYHRFGQSSFRDSLLRLYKSGLRSIVLPRTDVVIANSMYEKETLCEDFSVSGKTALIPLGIDLEEVKRVRWVPEEPKRVLYVGALKPYKNVDKIIEGFAWLVRKKDAGFRLVIVGQGSEYDSLVSLARRLRIDQFVEWKRGLSRQQLLDEYAKASVFVLLSSLESFSLVVYEALIIGVPAVVLNFGALANLVNAGLAEGVNSLSARGIADAVLRSTKKTYVRISDDMNIFLDWQDYLRRIISIYNGLLER
jgi:glycosyltransferase involved in cell wall biosynthesis